MVNILMLTGAFFMLQVYDRVIPSGSVPTLMALSILVVGLYFAQAILDLMKRSAGRSMLAMTDAELALYF